MTAVLIVTGAPATGKTMLGRRLARDLRLPFINKDDIKEILFETLGYRDRAWSRHLGVASYALLYHVLRQEIEAGRSVAIEANFDRAHATAELKKLGGVHPFHPVQVLCRAERSTIIERYRVREGSGERHPGHQGALSDLEALLCRGPFQPLDLDGPVIEVDTTDFQALRYDHILQAVRDAIRSG